MKEDDIEKGWCYASSGTLRSLPANQDAALQASSGYSSSFFLYHHRHPNYCLTEYHRCPLLFRRQRNKETFRNSGSDKGPLFLFVSRRVKVLAC